MASGAAYHLHRFQPHGGSAIAAFPIVLRVRRVEPSGSREDRNPKALWSGYLIGT